MIPNKSYAGMLEGGSNWQVANTGVSGPLRIKVGRAREKTPQAVKQAQIEVFLQQLDLMAHRYQDHGQFISSLLEAHEQSGSFECAKRIQGRQSNGYG
jgi:hypothetical protein